MSKKLETGVHIKCGILQVNFLCLQLVRKWESLLELAIEDHRRWQEGTISVGRTCL